VRFGFLFDLLSHKRNLNAEAKTTLIPTLCCSAVCEVSCFRPGTTVTLGSVSLSIPFRLRYLITCLQSIFSASFRTHRLFFFLGGGVVFCGVDSVVPLEQRWIRVKISVQYQHSVVFVLQSISSAMKKKKKRGEVTYYK
jgi:hypothetical protein